jgi:hypothetical protein
MVNIENWKIDRIMQLPDCCFGRKFPIFVTTGIATTAWVVDISEVGFPDPCVIWQVVVGTSSVGPLDVSLRLGLGQSLPANDNVFSTIEPFLHGMGVQGIEPRTWHACYIPGILCIDLKIAMNTGGKKLCMCSVASAAVQYRVNVVVIVSSIPKEIPDSVALGFK